MSRPCTRASLFALASAASVACGSRREANLERTPPPIAWVGAARQHGCVGYRDPPAAISPDGQLVAYAEGRFLRIRPVVGGPFEALEPTPTQIRAIQWHPDGNRVLVETNRDPRRYWIVDRAAHATAPFFGAEVVLHGEGEMSHDVFTARQDELDSATWSRDGSALAGLVQRHDATEVWSLPSPGAHAVVTVAQPRITSIAFAPSGDVACATVDASGRRRVALRCSAGARSELHTSPSLAWYGPLAFSPDGATLYAAAPSPAAPATLATLDLWAIHVADGHAAKLTSFDRDTYAPSVARDGSVLFQLSSYRTNVAVVGIEGGPVSLRATFQSETPFWDPTGARLAVTFGSWRRQVQDVAYPDIDQHIGVIAARGAVATTGEDLVPHVRSEDQAGSWSPDGRWFSYHSHRDGSDDIWLRGASDAGAGRRVTFFSRGAETFWPRWSPDGTLIAVATTSKRTGRHAPFLIGIDRATGATTSEAHEIEGLDVDADITDLAFRPDGEELVGHAQEGPGRQAIVVFSRHGGAARVVHRYATEHVFPGFALSPDGAEVAFVAPADGFQQIFRLPLASGDPRQVTTDPSNKTQPAWSPDGRTLALTVWDYSSQLWMIRAQ